MQDVLRSMAAFGCLVNNYFKGNGITYFPLYAGPNWRYFFGFGIIWTYQKWVIKIIKNRVICFRKISLSMEKMLDV